MISKDLIQDSNGDLLIQNGDFVVGPSDFQHIYDIIQSYVGWWKQNPQIGVGIRSYLGSAGMQQTLQRSIKLQLQADNYNNISVTSTTNPDGTFNITVKASRNGSTINGTFANVGA